MSQISRREPRPSFLLRFAMGVAIVIVLAVVFIPRPERPQSPTPVTTITPPPVVVAPVQRIVPVPHAAPVRVARRRPRLKQPEMRVYIQTADPDIRIIWIVNPKQS